MVSQLLPGGQPAVRLRGLSPMVISIKALKTRPDSRSERCNVAAVLMLYSSNRAGRRPAAASLPLVMGEGCAPASDHVAVPRHTPLSELGP
jgi:hypothetical protein